MTNNSMKSLSIPRSYLLNNKLNDDLLIFVLRLKAEFENGHFSIYDIPATCKKLKYNNDTFIRLLDEAINKHFLTDFNITDDFKYINDFKLLMKDYVGLFVIAHKINNITDKSDIDTYLCECDKIINKTNYREFLQKSFLIISIILKRYTRTTLYINTFLKMSEVSISSENQSRYLESILSATSNIIMYLKSDVVLKRRLSFSESYFKNQFNTILYTFDNVNTDKSGINRIKNNGRKLNKDLNRFKQFILTNKELVSKANKCDNIRGFFNHEKSQYIKINSFRPKSEQLKNKLPVNLDDKDSMNISISQYDWLQMGNYDTINDLLIRPEVNHKIDINFIKNNDFNIIRKKLSELRILYLIKYELKDISYSELSSHCGLCRSKTIELINEMVKSKKIFKQHFESILIQSGFNESISKSIKGLCFMHNGSMYMKPKNQYKIVEEIHNSWQTSKKENKNYVKNERFINIMSLDNPFRELQQKLQKLHDKNIDRINHFKVRFNNRTFYIYVNFKGTHFEVYKSTKNTYYRNLINETHVESYMLYKFLGKNSSVIMYSTEDYESVKLEKEEFISRFFNKRSNTNFFGEEKKGFELLYHQH